MRDYILLVLYMKIGLRYGMFVIAGFILLETLFINTYFLTLIFIQDKFINVFNQYEYHSKLIFITGSNVSNSLILYNSIWLFYFNFWLIVSELITSLSLHFAVLPFEKMINFNILILICFSLGNQLSLRNVFNISFLNQIFKYIIFCIVIILSYTYIKFLEFYNIHVLWNVFTLAIISVTWMFLSPKAKKYPKNLVNKT